jgi:hypothetical protein
MSFNQYSNTRQEGESFEDYRLRVRSEKFRVQLVRRGVSTWNSRKQGTYTKVKAMQLKAAQAMVQIEKDKQKEKQNG